MIEFISQPWTWYVSGFLIAVVMLLLLLENKSFGMSSNLSTMCSIGGAGKVADLFKFNWKDQKWNLLVLVGTVIGGFVASTFLTPDASIDLNVKTVQALNEMGFSDPGTEYLPDTVFGWEAITSFKGLTILIIGGFFVGFGSRYAGGCTSGHAISGLSNLQFPSLIAVIGFFIGGLLVTHLVLPLIF
jgi:uncharacterized protein